MISAVGFNSSMPSFKGIVKVSRVMVDGRPSYYYKDFDSCGLQLKNILLKKKDKPSTTQNMEEFRQTYSLYDPDYTPPEIKVDGYTADTLAKVRTGKSTFIVSGADAKYIDDAGFNIGKKHNLELNSEDGENAGAEDSARDAYIAAKEELPGKFLSRERAKLGHPQLVLYAARNAKGKPVLSGVMIKNDFEESKAFSFVPKKKVSQPKPAVEVKPASVRPQVKPEQAIKAEITSQEPKKEEKNPILEELSKKSWPVLPKKKTRKRKIVDNPNQMLLF